PECRHDRLHCAAQTLGGPDEGGKQDVSPPEPELLASHKASPVGDCTIRPSLGSSGGLFLPYLQARRVLAEYSNIAQVYSPIPRTVYFTGQIRILDDRLVRPETNLSQHGNRDEDEPALEGVGSVNRVSAHFCNGIPLVKLERE